MNFFEIDPTSWIGKSPNWATGPNRNVVDGSVVIVFQQETTDLPAIRKELDWTGKSPNWATGPDGKSSFVK